jgi:hypothetical protein
VTDAPPPDRPKGRSLKPLRSLLPFLRPHVGTMLLALGALLISDVLARRVEKFVGQT